MTARNGTIGRGEIVARLIAAIPANYLVTSAATACIARLLWRGMGVDPANASVAATLISFALFAVLALVAFGARSVVKLWLWLAGSGLTLGITLWFSLSAGARI